MILEFTTKLRRVAIQTFTTNILPGKKKKNHSNQPTTEDNVDIREQWRAEDKNTKRFGK